MISAYDMFFLKLFHGMANGLFTFLFKLITLLGEKGILFFLLALVLMCFAKTRKFGICLFGAVACGALITNVILKDSVARIRPFEALDTYRQWWEAVGSPKEDGFSFPSGHVTAAAAGCTAVCLMKGKKWIAPSVVWVLLMMIARNYLMAHYPTDVLAGAVIGIASGFIAWYITKFIYRFLRSKRGKKWADFVLDYNVPVTVIGIPKLGFNIDLEKIGLRGEVEEEEDEAAFFDDDEEEDVEDEEEDEKPSRGIRLSKPQIRAPQIRLPSSKSTYVGKHEKH